MASVPVGHGSPAGESVPYETTSTPRGPSAAGSVPTKAPNRQLPECAWLTRNFWLVAVASRRTITSERTSPFRSSSNETLCASQPDAAPAVPFTPGARLGVESADDGAPPFPVSEPGEVSSSSSAFEDALPSAAPAPNAGVSGVAETRHPTPPKTNAPRPNAV